LGVWLGIANQIPDRAAVIRAMEAFGAKIGPGPLGLRDASAQRKLVLEFAQGLRAQGWGREAVKVLTEASNRAIPETAIIPGMLELADLRDTFEAIAQADSNTDNQWLPLPAGPAAGLRVEKGRIRLRPAAFLSAFEGVEVERIRKCPVCGLFFWAGRLNKSACAEPCARVLRQRKLRENRKHKKTKQKKVS
jgi:hypothetical protein